MSMVAVSPIALPDWIRGASASISDEEYLDCAVGVALELAKRLVARASGPTFFAGFDPWKTSKVDDWAGGSWRRYPSSLVRLEDITLGNVRVSVSNDARTARARFTATEVTIQRANSERSQPTELSSRDACFALGRILFELFSRGAPLPLIDLGPNEGESFRNLLLGDAGSIEDGAAAHAAKRSQPSAYSRLQPTFMKARLLLQDRGMPLSICRLVSDLLETGRGGQYMSDTALVSLDEAHFDLTRMVKHPLRFLHDQTSLTKALDDTALFKQAGSELYGRREEVGALMNIARRIAVYGRHPSDAGTDDFLCEVAFLSGHSGSGKSSIIKNVVSFCDEDDWSVLMCKFDRQVAPLSTLMKSFDAYFGKLVPRRVNGIAIEREPPAQEAFNRISRSIIDSLDNESFTQLCVLLPNFRKLFPMSYSYLHTRLDGTRSGSPILELINVVNERSAAASSSGAVGSGRERLSYLIHILLQALCGGGRPVLVCLEDMQWLDAATIDMFHDFIQTVGYGAMSPARGELLRGGLLYLGSFRDNEVGEVGFLMDQIRCMERSGANINVTKIFVGELTEHDINEMISFKFCLPIRHTRELAQLVYQKTRGNPLYVVEFLRSIVQRNFVSFSVRDRKWVWDNTPIDMEMISEGVVELLTMKLRQLPSNVIRTLKVISCFGFQINLSTIQLLDLGQFVPNMIQDLEFAKKEGILDKAGPVFAFTHDMLQETSYNLIPADERQPLHKTIALSLASVPGIARNPELCKVTADQINICRGLVCLDEKVKFAGLYLAAGQHSVCASSYEQARGYFESGISLLHSNHWDEQYSLSLSLYEMSVITSFMDGKIETVSTRLNEIFSNAKSFDDTLNARAMRAKFLASQENFAEATSDILDILSKYGEDFPDDLSLPMVMSEINATLPALRDITREKLLSLPTMTDFRKQNAMRFMGLLYSFINLSSPMLLPLLCCRIIKLTLESGFWEDSILGLAFMSHVLVLHSVDSELASKLTTITESFVKGNPNEHSLRARFTGMVFTVKSIVEPAQGVTDFVLMGYKSAAIVGDVDNGMYCALLYTATSFYHTRDLQVLTRTVVNFMHKMAKHKRNGVLHSTMSYFSACQALIGNDPNSYIIDGRIIQSNNELYQIAEKTQNSFLMHQVILNQMYVHCYFREYVLVSKLAKEYQTKIKAKRILECCHDFCYGIAALCLARDTKGAEQEEWGKIGEACVNAMQNAAQLSCWNFESNSLLLQALLHQLNNRHEMAELTYKASISSACDHRYLQEEALAHEHFGLYLLDIKQLGRGMEQLQLAMDKYKQWGGAKKADQVKDFMDLIS